MTRLLTTMMRSPVILVPSLAKVPSSILANVYVFADGIKTRSAGPLGYQPGVFDGIPGDLGYTPLAPSSSLPGTPA